MVSDTPVPQTSNNDSGDAHRGSTVGEGTIARRFRLERPLRAFYEGVHHFRGHAGLLVGVFVFTTAIQAVRVLSIWAAGSSLTTDTSPSP